MPDLAWETAALAALATLATPDDLNVPGGDTAVPQTPSAISATPAALVGGMDEVGRGALAGPVCVGVSVIGAEQLAVGFPPGLNDSKVLTPRRRVALVAPLQSWVKDFAIGEATNTEIDELGIMAALRLAGWRALNQLDARGNLPQKLLLDGNVDYLQAPRETNLFDSDWHLMNPTQPEVQTLIHGDRQSATVAGAAVLAKVYRDAFMSGLEDPGYGWNHNAGYGTKEHREAIRRLGVSRWHRQTWKLRPSGKAESTFND